MFDDRQLQAQHVALCAAMRHLLDVASAERGFRAAAPGLLRDLDAAIIAHVASETMQEYTAIVPGAEPPGVLETDWRRFADHWSTTRIAGDWAGFSAAANAIVPRMIARIEQEDACLARRVSRSAASARG